MTLAPTEKQYQAQIVELARNLGWTVRHPPASRTGNGRWTAGSMTDWPDLTLIRPPRLVVAEVKGAKTKITPGQVDMLALLDQIDSVEVHVWRVGVDSIQAIADILAPKVRA